jgi:hypothetical protein
MSTNRELVKNSPLSGTELKQIILRDVESILSSDGLLASQIAYSRVAYDVTVRIHTDNPSNLENVVRVPSKPRPADNVAEAAIEAGPSLPPATTSNKQQVSGAKRTRNIVSPNSARVEHSLPITVQRLGQDGHLKDEQVKYPPEAAEPDPSLVTDTDITEETRREFGVGPAKAGG